MSRVIPVHFSRQLWYIRRQDAAISVGLVHVLISIGPWYAILAFTNVELGVQNLKIFVL